MERETVMAPRYQNRQRFKNYQHVFALELQKFKGGLTGNVLDGNARVLSGVLERSRVQLGAVGRFNVGGHSSIPLAVL